MVRNATLRLQKYSIKINPDSIKQRFTDHRDNMINQEEAIFGELVLVESKAKSYLESMGVPTIQAPFYLDFARQCYKYFKKFSQTTRTNEVQYWFNHWVSRGLIGTHLAKVAELCGVTISEEGPGETRNFGYETLSELFEVPIEDWVSGSVFTMPENGEAESITAGLKRTGMEVPSHVKCAIYRHSDLSLVGSTEERTIIISDTPTWSKFNFIIKPHLVAGVEYILVAWSDDTDADVCLMADFGDADQTHVYGETYNGFPDPLNPLGVVHFAWVCSIYCTYST